MEIYYIEATCTVTPTEPFSDLLMAELGALGFESFEQTPKGIKAYILASAFDDSLFDGLETAEMPGVSLSFSTQRMAQENWNQTWEENFEPIVVGSDCAVRAPFHAPINVTHDLVIMPKMSFGTGHHETTFMMLSLMLEDDFSGQSVLDMGSGTAVLAILAERLGADSVTAIDIDPWCFENAQENVALNDCTRVEVQQGDASVLGSQTYQCIIANINRNILLADIPTYTAQLEAEGRLYLSGFYQEDLPMIDQACQDQGLVVSRTMTKNNWVAGIWVKS